GGGMYLFNSNALIDGCVFLNNLSRRVIAVWDPFSAKGWFDGYGGGLELQQSSPTVINCAFIGNYAMSAGGGIYSWDHSSPVVTNCTFSGNVAGREGKESGFGANKVDGTDFYTYTTEIFILTPGKPVLTNNIMWGAAGDDSADYWHTGGLHSIADRNFFGDPINLANAQYNDMMLG
ncbi:MAG: hypothetical protein GY869_32015, partial [Planctomycetes bacterium]|nr:hypothetical protein [Planctomycetota bacterium]